MAAKKIKALMDKQDFVELKTITVIRKTAAGTVELNTYLSEQDGAAKGQRISSMKDQPLECLNRTQVSTQ